MTVLSPRWDLLYWCDEIFILNQGPGYNSGYMNGADLMPHKWEINPWDAAVSLVCQSLALCMFSNILTNISVE